ncbi:Rossmann-like domain-containing protein [Haliea sp. E17]|uniref:Rossmann-like domain-containing protein n=1 Tax=Haliea sp. E17 TaxID=3401576 RepID=UPI003AAA4FB0
MSLLQDRAASSARLQRVLFGLNWSIAETEASTGLCFSPLQVARNIDWPGSLAGRPADNLLPWLGSERHIEVAAAVATVNAVLNGADNPLLRAAEPLCFEAAPHLSVFHHFAGQLDGARVVVIGRYPGIEQHLPDFDYQCVERRPGPGDLPAEAAPEVLAQADWAFITASSLANGTLADLLHWSRNARSVLMGPSLPWLADWADYGVDFIAGVEVLDRERLGQVVGEAGGTRIFNAAVRYRLLQLA